MDSILILHSVNMEAAREVFCVMSIFLKFLEPWGLSTAQPVCLRNRRPI